MLDIPVLRMGKPYDSLEKETVTHFLTGEPVAEVSQANEGLVTRDIKKSGKKARDALRAIPPADLVGMMKKAADLYLNADLPLGNGTQSPEDFAQAQAATTGLPVKMARANMEKNHFVLSNMDRILDALTRGLDLEILNRGYGMESRGVVVSYQCMSSVLGMVLPSNSPGVHTLWLPVIPMQVGLVLKPGSQEPWTPYRIASAFLEAGVPPEAIGIYPGPRPVGQAVMAHCGRSMIFGNQQTIEQFRSNPKVQVHGSGFSKIILGDDVVDQWEDYLDLMVASVFKNSGRGCINCSGIWASRHTEEIAAALAERMGPAQPLPPDDPEASISAFTNPAVARAVWEAISVDLKKDSSLTHATEPYGPRLVDRETHAYLLPTVIRCESPDQALANTEYMFPFVSVVKCPQDQMITKMDYTLVCSAITNDPSFRGQLIDATNIDRLNLGPIPTIKLDWLQPHEGNIVDFLFHARSLQVAEGDKLVGAA